MKKLILLLLFVPLISFGQTAEDYFNSGNNKFKKNNYFGAGAIADYSKAIELDPEYAAAYSNRGIAKSDLKDYYGAIADYTKAIEINPDYADAYSNRGVAKADLKDYYGAIADYSKAIELNSDYVDAYYNRGNAKYDLKDYKEAIVESLNLLRMSQLIIFLEIKR